MRTLQALAIAAVLLAASPAWAVGLIDCNLGDDLEEYLKCSAEWRESTGCTHATDPDDFLACIVERGDSPDEPPKLAVRDDDFDQLVRDVEITICARDLLLVSIVETNRLLGMDAEAVASLHAASPSTLQGRLNDALLEGSAAIATILHGLVVSPQEDEMPIIDICRDVLGAGSEPAETLADTACEELMPSPLEPGGPEFASLLRPLYCGEGDMIIVGTPRPEDTDQ